MKHLAVLLLMAFTFGATAQDAYSSYRGRWQGKCFSLSVGEDNHVTTNWEGRTLGSSMIMLEVDTMHAIFLLSNENGLLRFMEIKLHLTDDHTALCRVEIYHTPNLLVGSDFELEDDVISFECPCKRTNEEE